MYDEPGCPALQAGSLPPEPPGTPYEPQKRRLFFFFLNQERVLKTFKKAVLQIGSTL